MANADDKFFGGDLSTQSEIKVKFPGLDIKDILDQVTLKEVFLGESLLNPSLQTAVTVHSYFHNIPIKNLDRFKTVDVELEINRPSLEAYNITPKLEVRQKVYRLDNRFLYNNVTEEFTLHACDQTLLDSAATLVSKMWKCTTPSDVTREVLASCAGAKSLDIEPSLPARDYVAENIQPFQVVSQQKEAALAAGNDPSFLHYMTYENFGTHHFRSLKTLCAQSPICEYEYSETGYRAGQGNPFSIITHSFPCDFDLLSDILNGIDQNGNDINSMMVYNPLKRMFNMVGSQTYGCGIGSGNPKMALSNQGSEKDQNACPDYSQYYVLKRQARMGLLEKDKIALSITVPFNPELHVGKIIRLNLYNKNEPTQKNYGSGDYLILHLTHKLQYGGYSVTSMDCVSKTVGQGEV